MFIKRPRTHIHFGLISLILALALTGYGFTAYHKPVPLLKPTVAAISSQQQAATPHLNWPAQGQAAIGTLQHGLLATNGDQHPVPTASTAKVMVALAVLDKKPLSLNQPGPMITITDDDVAVYRSYIAKNGSITRVVAGETITEYQALQALLLPSSNNMAYTLARWAFGSLGNYTAYANQMASRMGLKHTNIADASGFSPQTVSSAEDLVNIGIVALKHPVIAQIVGQPSAEIPVAGTIRNTNMLLGQEGIVGIKTGNTDEAGGCYIFAAKHKVEGQELTIVGSVMGAPSLWDAMRDSLLLLRSTKANFVQQTVVKQGTVVGSYTSTWGKTVKAVAGSDLSTIGWAGSAPHTSVELQKLPVPLTKNQVLGKIVLDGTNRSVPVITQEALDAPSWQWRLTNAL